MVLGTCDTRRNGTGIPERRSGTPLLYPETAAGTIFSMRYVPPSPARRRRPETSEQLRRLVETEESRHRAEERPFDPEAPRQSYAQSHHFAVNARHNAPADQHAATELVLFIENTADLSPDGPHGQGRSVLLNALRKWRKGTYEPALAVRLFEYLAEAGAKRYAREYDHASRWSEMFNPATRREVARQLEESFRASVERGEYDDVSLRLR